MKTLKFTVSDVRFNPAFGVFEAMAIFETTYAIVKVPAHYAAPVTAEFDLVSKGLSRSALRALTDPNAPKSLQMLKDQGDALPLAA